MIHKVNYSDIFSKIDDMISQSKEVTVAVEGSSGSGKSTLAEALSSIYDCNVFHMDDFFLRPEQRTEGRMQQVGGNVDYERFKTEVLDKLKKGTVFEYQIYDCSVGRFTDNIRVSPKKLNIVEGVYSMHPTLRDAYDLKIFLKIDTEVQKKRILLRGGEYMLQRFLNEWIPLENEYFSKMNISERCDLVITSL